MNYPNVLDEYSTLAAVLAGRSIARYGDGEFKHAIDGCNKSQSHDDALSRRMRQILRDSGECLVGIPNIHGCAARNTNLDKVEFWLKQRRFASLLIEREYVSSFITRPDSAPWIDTDAYWAQVESLWVDQEVTLVRGSGKSLTADDLVGAASVTEIQPRPAANGKQQHAWQQYEELLERIGTPRRALICLGPTATVMAVDLCAMGVHAIDLGHIGMFLRKRRRGEPMWVSPEDKVAP